MNAQFCYISLLPDLTKRVDDKHLHHPEFRGTFVSPDYMITGMTPCNSDGFQFYGPPEFVNDVIDKFLASKPSQLTDLATFLRNLGWSYFGNAEAVWSKAIKWD